MFLGRKEANADHDRQLWRIAPVGGFNENNIFPFDLGTHLNIIPSSYILYPGPLLTIQSQPAPLATQSYSPFNFS